MFKVLVQNKDFIIIRHYLRLLQTSCKMKFVSCMSDITRIWKHKMIIGMPI